jgi:molybdopterin-binding protein
MESGNTERGLENMLTSSRNALVGEIISVTHTADSCRITIELQGTPAVTASLMKQRLVELGLMEGAPVLARVDAPNVLIGLCGVEAPAVQC